MRNNSLKLTSPASPVLYEAHDCLLEAQATSDRDLAPQRYVQYPLVLRPCPCSLHGLHLLVQRRVANPFSLTTSRGCSPASSRGRQTLSQAIGPEQETIWTRSGPQRRRRTTFQDGDNVQYKAMRQGRRTPAVRGGPPTLTLPAKGGPS